MSKLNLTGLFILSVSCEYVLIQQQKTWDDAQAYCRQNHFDLATVQSTEDWTNVQKAVGPSFTTVAWIGLYNDINTWRWSYQDEPLTYLSWYYGEPNNNNGIQECATFYGDTFHDMVCTETKLFLCYNEDQVGANRFVLVTDVARSWSDAQTYCRQHHTDLATIRTQAENDQLAIMMSSYSYAWIGLFRDSWKWSDGTNVSMSSIYWVLSFGDITDKDRPCSVVTSGGLKDDRLCSAYQNFICKLCKKKQILRLEMISGKNVKDPAVMGAILQSSRKIYVSFEDIFKNIQELTKSLSDQKTCLLQDNKFWEELCIVLGVPNTSPNRYKLKRTYKDENMTNVQTEEDEKEDAPEAEGAQAEEFTQDLSDFQKEDGKEHTKKKDILKDEECLKAEEGNKDSEKPKEFGQ
ncbi:C-type lectin domain family 10 member A MMGL [Triplophysa tibetana]|uniref:C-type lectin domain family 10 member A MMGL n=1 Tax=Triplophysa tibetana TaxID=1572043 RepID=A0A5A9PFS1_9TELE|nr:C-type lectin domain family 10 member A MMGL [Triplophysa tibetana]